MDSKQAIKSKIDAIRNAPKSNTREVPCNEFKPDDWPDDGDFMLYVKSLSGPARARMERDANKGKFKKKPEKLRALMLRGCVFSDPEFKELTFAEFTDDEIENLNPVPRERLFDVSLTLSGMSNKEIDELAGN